MAGTGGEQPRPAPAAVPAGPRVAARHFGELAELVSEEAMSAPAGPDPDVHLSGIRGYVDAGFDEVYIGQVGGEHEGFFEFYANTVLPRLRDS